MNRFPVFSTQNRMEAVIAKLQETAFTVNLQDHPWKNCLQQGEVTHALQHLRDLLSVPPEFAWSALALPMDSSEFMLLSSLLQISLQPPENELACFLVDQCINHDSFEQYNRLATLALASSLNPQPPGEVSLYSHSDGSMYECYQRIEATGSPFRLHGPVLSAALKRGKWNFALDHVRDHLHSVGPVPQERFQAALPILLREWESGTFLSAEILEEFCQALQEDWHKSPGRTRPDEILWNAFARDATIFQQYLLGYAEDALDNRQIDLLHCTFTDPVRFEQLGQEKGTTMDECLDYLAARVDWITDSYHTWFLRCYLWSDINQFTALQNRLINQYAADHANCTAHEAMAHLQKECRDRFLCMRSCLDAIIELSATDRSRGSDEGFIQRLVGTYPEQLREEMFKYIRTSLGVKQNIMTCAAACWSAETVAILLDAGGGDLLRGEKEGRPGPLYYALLRGDQFILHMLLERGARGDLLTPTLRNRTRSACRGGRIIRLIENFRWDCRSEAAGYSRKKPSAVHLVELLKVVEEGGTNQLLIPDYQGATPL